MATSNWLLPTVLAFGCLGKTFNSLKLQINIYLFVFSSKYLNPSARQFLSERQYIVQYWSWNEIFRNVCIPVSRRKKTVL